MWTCSQQAVGSETSRFPYFIDNRLTDGDEVVSITPLPETSNLNYVDIND
jgi:hypothetical protein